MHRTVAAVVLAWLAVAAGPSPAAAPAEKVLDAQLRVVAGLERQLQAIVRAAEVSADRLVAGGNLYLAGEPGMVAELAGRAGGLCGARPLGFDKPLPKLGGDDVVLFSHYGNTSTVPADFFARLVNTPATLVVFASADNPVVHGKRPPRVKGVPVELGMEPRLIRGADGGRYVSAAGPALSTAQWAYTAELLGACRRRGKQLAVYLSIFLDPGQKRFQRTKGLLFEPDLKPDPVPAGAYAQTFLRAAGAALEGLRAEQPKFRQAAEWIAAARAEGKRVVRQMYGHLPPAEVGLPGDVPLFAETIRLRDQARLDWVKQHLGPGDVFVFSAMRAEDELAAEAHRRGARTIFLTATPPSAEQAARKEHLHVPPHWSQTDACLELPGYDVKACPLSCIAGLAAFQAICAEATAVSLDPVSLVFDTDMGNDIDDALALACIHALQSRGECRLLAVTLTKDNRYAAPFIDLVNTFYGRGNIPIGVVRGGPTPQDSAYIQQPCQATDDGKQRYPHDLVDGGAAPEATGLLRKVLAAEPDGSVVMVQVGFSTNLARLLDSPGDEHSPLAGMELVKKKVRLLSTMAGSFTESYTKRRFREYNVFIDLPSARKVYGQWPTPIVFSGHEIGTAVHYTVRSIEEDFRYVPHHPIAEAYTLYMRMPYDRPTYDLTSVLYAVRPGGGYFGLSPAGRVTVEDDAFTRFDAAADGPHRHLIVDPAAVERVREVLENLASQPPNGKGRP